MRLSRKSVVAASVLLLCILLVAGLACESKDRYAGTYEVQGKAEEVRLELKASGEGLWISGSQEVSFSWYIKSGEFRIHAKEGGVIVGEIQGDTIKIKIPGQKEMLFQKAP